MANILIIGATSPIARATAMAFAKAGNNIYLSGRDKTECEKIAADIHIRYGVTAEVKSDGIDLDGMVYAIGTMEGSTEELLTINFNQAVLYLEKYAPYFEQKKSGFIIGITSVAGDRGRQSNYIYGSAKGGLSIYLEGLRNRLYKSNVRVITIKPGFVDTAMTFGLPKLFLVADPQKIGEAIANTVNKKSDVFYLPWFWKYIMLIIKTIPEFLYKRLSL